MKKNVKMLTLALSLLLVIGSVIGVTAFAADTPSVEIVRKNISYDGAVKTLYAIEAENIGSGKVAVQFYSVDPSEEGATADYTKLASDKITLGEKEYDVVFSQGFRPTDLRKTIYAVPVILNGSNVIAKGAAVEYSPYIYAMNRFDKEATADQLTLYTALLEYGAAVQRILSTPDEVTANGGYADEYYKVTVNSAVATKLNETPATVTKTYSKAQVLAGEIVADATYGGESFVAWADANNDLLRTNDNTLTSLEIAPGANTFTALYGKYDIVRYEESDFAEGNPAGFIETAYNINTVCENTTASFAFKKDHPEWNGTSSLVTVDGTMVHTKELLDKESFTGTDQNYADANYQWWRMWFTGSAGDQDIYIAQFDVKFNNVGGYGNYFLEANDHTIRVEIKASKEQDENGYVKYFTLGNATLENDKFYTIRYEWYSDSDTVAVYVDGKLAYTQTSAKEITKDINYNSFSFSYGSYLTGVTTFDNMYFATACVHNDYVVDSTNKDAIVKDASKTFYTACAECRLVGTDTAVYEGSHKGGTYYNSALLGTRYDMNATPMFTRSSTDGFKYSVADGVLNIENTAYAVNTIRVLNASGSESSVTLTPGTKFVAEFDFMYTGYDAASANTDIFQFMGIAGMADSGSGSCSWSGSYLYYTEKYYAHFEQKNIDAALAQDVWYNYRLEYTLKADGTGTIDKYVNDVLVESNAAGKLKDATTVPTVLYGWAFESRGTSIPVTYSMDNMFFGIICTGDHNFAEDITNGYAYIGEGKFYKSCSKCGFITNEEFVGVEGVALGTGTYYGNAEMSGYRHDYSGVNGIWIGTDANKGTHTGGTSKYYNLAAIDGNNVLNLQADSDSIWSTAALRPGYNVGFVGDAVQAGDKIVTEFDFIIRDGKNTGDNCYIKFALAATTTGGDSSKADNTQLSPQTLLIANADGITHKLGSATLYEGVWYNIRIEQTVGGEYSLYVNDVLAETSTYTSTPAKNMYYGLSVVTRGQKVDVSFDNFYASITPAAAE